MRNERSRLKWLDEAFEEKKANPIEGKWKTINQPLKEELSKVGIWRRLHSHIMCDLQGYNYGQIFEDTKEADIIYNSKIATEPIIYKSFKERCDDATEFLRFLTKNSK